LSNFMVKNYPAISIAKPQGRILATCPSYPSWKRFASASLPV
jgi:hypothetical protein